MIKITRIIIKRYRSILDVDLIIDPSIGLTSFCGQNNVGKTNILRAINLFFNPDDYNISEDMPRIKHATGGQSIHPKIEICFYNDSDGYYYAICRDLKDFCVSDMGLSGQKFLQNGKKKISKSALSPEDASKFLENIEFAYIESINTIIPDLVKKLTDEMIDLQYDKTRFSDSKRELKDAYEKYVDGLDGILKAFSTEISSTFQRFQADWNVEFVVPRNSSTFRDLISDDISLTLDDHGGHGIADKGAGLQRLSTILLTFEILSRLHKKKQVIACVDEPDVYLHEGLQRKLKDLFDEKSSKMQIFCTTHSKIFMNPYNMKNTFLLAEKNYEQHSVRKNKKIYVTETVLEDITEDAGYNKICNHLGIERVSYELLQPTNLLVEGNCDKKYISELCGFYGIICPNVESINGADNAEKYLSFYDSYYKNNQCEYKPIIKLILDNDSEGRKILSKISAKTEKYNHIDVSCSLVNNFANSANLSAENNRTNNEIEDLLYPEVVCFLINTILSKKGMNQIPTNAVCSKIAKNAFAARGILDLCENEKNTRNPDNGDCICFTSSSKTTNQIKEGLAALFNIQANKNLIRIITECDEKYPCVRETITSMCSF